jgi:polyphosphate kinase
MSTILKPPAATDSPALSVEDEFLDRDLTWLEFNRRVLQEALSTQTPLLERLRFLGIFTSNLDEFFMKRVGRLKRNAAHGMVPKYADELPSTQILGRLRQRIVSLLQQQAHCYTRQLRPALAEAGVHLLDWEQLSDQERTWANQYFRTTVFPVLTPLAVDPGHPFPFMSNLSTSLGVVVLAPSSQDRSFARLKVPEVLPQWVQLPATNGSHRFVSLLTLVGQNLQDLFPGMNIVDSMPFRLTRDAEVELEGEAEDLRDLVAQELRQRRFGQVVRLEHGPKPSPWMVQFLVQELRLGPQDVYELPAELDYTDFRNVTNLNLPRLRFEPWTPMVPPVLADEEEDIFSIIRRGDVLVHHPYESFNASVERFVQAAADDPRVLAIKMTVYRTGDESPFLHTLIRAAEAGKQVVCLVELKARFDEERNILLARALEEAGVHVVYGLVGLKTHTKVTLVVRQDPDRIRCYAHIGTGNYNVETARLYTDLGLLTCNPAINEDLVELFHYLTGRSVQRSPQKLLVAPHYMRDRFLQMIEREAEHHRQGKPAHILAKMNSLEDHKIIRALYRASQAGVPVDLVVRGFCRLRPGVPQLSPTIRVLSVVGRYLEHSRIFHFRNGCDDPLDGEFYFGSADWMYRNLLFRVEAVVPIEDRALRQRLWEILQVMLNDNCSAWEMQPDGSYRQRRPIDDQAPTPTQQVLMHLTRLRCTGGNSPIA